MRKRNFRPTSLDVLEDRLVLSTIAHPAIVHAESAVANPKFLNLTGRTEGQIVNGITAAFNRFSAIYHSGTSSAATQAKAFARLNSDLLAVSHKIPFGGMSLYPSLAALTTGSGGTNPKTGAAVPSLKTALAEDVGLADSSNIPSTISTYETIVRQTTNNYVNAGVTSGKFFLVRGATLPPVTSAS